MDQDQGTGLHGETFREIQRQIKMRATGQDPDNVDIDKDPLEVKKSSRKRSKMKVTPTDALRAAAFTINKDLSKSFYTVKTREHCIKDKRNVTELFTTVKHANKQGWPEKSEYHCGKVC